MSTDIDEPLWVASPFTCSGESPMAVAAWAKISFADSFERSAVGDGAATEVDAALLDDIDAA
jgi:hypothetical protein